MLYTLNMQLAKAIQQDRLREFSHAAATHRIAQETKGRRQHADDGRRLWAWIPWRRLRPQAAALLELEGMRG
jgi:hypothetical protein